MEYLTGSMLSPYDARDYVVVCENPSELPQTFELDFSNISVKNQGSVGSCVAHAMSTILEYHTKGKYDLSTNFFYGIQNKLFNQNSIGMYPRQACEIALKYGDPIYDDCPGNYEIPNCRPVAEKAFNNAETMTKAADFKVKAYYVCNKDEDIKYALVNYGPILGSIKWYKQYNIDKDGVLIKKPNATWESRHAIVIYGYNEKGWLCQNSWGVLWGKRGKFILPYGSHGMEARGLIDMENETYIAPPKKNKFMNIFYKYFINICVNVATEIFSWFKKKN